jgi:DNA-binding NtrC family response regulator
MSSKLIRFTESEKAFATAIVRLNRANPFTRERIECERAALGSAFVTANADWNLNGPGLGVRPNVARLHNDATALVTRLAAAWPKLGGVTAAEAELYVQVAVFWLFHQYADRFDAALQATGANQRIEFYPAFRADAEKYLALPGLTYLEEMPVPHLFACLFQVRRAFFHIYQSLVGGSTPMARLRASIWQSIFTHDIERYRRSLYARMGDFATLVTGPSGTGKELVARAVALSRYLAFDPKRATFAGELDGGYFPLNLSALSPTLIESELFGHRRGAFTGAVADRAGWMEVCPAHGTVFLDEIGDVDASIQVKLLRVLQSRQFQRLGDTGSRDFGGKIIAATHRDLAAEIRAGRFREDFYYRLCSDQITTPSLREQMDASAEELPLMVGLIAYRLLEPGEAERVTRDAVAWIGKNLGASYAWPGNFRELEQCVRNLLIRRDYKPAGPLACHGNEDWNALLRRGTLTAEEVLTHYTRQVFAQADGNVEETARRMNLDRRTVKARLAPGG